MTVNFLDSIPLSELSGVGQVTADRLHKIGIFNLQDLLFHLPSRYEDRTQITFISHLRPNQHTTIEGIVQSCEIQFSRRPMLVVSLSDGTSKLSLRFFNFNAGMKQSFQIGTKIRAFGEVKVGRFMAEMHHPDYQILSHHPIPLSENLTPIYPTTEGMSQKIWQKLMSQALSLLEKVKIKELLPTAYNPYPYDLKDALRFLHMPDRTASIIQLEKGEHPAQKRLAFEELLAHHLAMQITKQKIQGLSAYALPKKTALLSQFLATLPFCPTYAQKRVSQEVFRDLAKSSPMMRLVQGDVGSGKTFVAGLASLVVSSHQKQVALMAPTDLLAEQHIENFKKWFEPLGIEIIRLTGKVQGKLRNETLAKIAQGKGQIIIGTHALFQEKIKFNCLALIIVDEQHRFGVDQRLQLREKGRYQNIYPHQLIMTATPIPRTLAMTIYADLDVSIIDELPTGRQPIQTIILSEERRMELIKRVNHACVEEKRQAYWVCTLIDENDTLEAQAVQVIFDDLKQILPHLKLGLLHGRMKPKEKQNVMQQFKSGDLDILIATTVIEVGVDVPNASLMIIENAERLGLSQLHQLRGRVGRGSTASFCVLMYKSPLGKISRQRLEVMRQTQDGFLIAEKDLELRGTGELLGIKQTGNIDFKVANLIRDQKMIPQVQHYAKKLLQTNPNLAEILIQRWIKNHQLYRHA